MRFRRKSDRPPKQVDKLDISGKPVYIFEDHSAALEAWAEERRRLPESPYLITFDTHTDTHTAFTRVIYYEAGKEMPDNVEDRSLQKCAAIDYGDAENVTEAVKRLANDEQIDCSIKTGIINAAFVISNQAVEPTKSKEESAHVAEFRARYDKDDPEKSRLKPFGKPIDELHYDTPENRMFILSVDAGFEDNPLLSEEENYRRHCDLAIESGYLNAKLKLAGKMAESLGIADLLGENFILDIDLDYFRTNRSISPQDPSVFYELIRGAIAVTVALEPSYVDLEKIEDEEITSEFLLEKLKKHILTAMNRSEIK